MSSSLPSSRAPHDESAPDGPLSVLLIEDNPGDARLFDEYLAESLADTTLRHEETLRDGRRALDADRPDVLVADLGLPDSDGTDTIRALAAAAPSVPIVVLTGQDDLETALEAQQAGAAEYLQKDQLGAALVGRTLRWAVQQHRMQAKLRQRDAWIRSITEGLSAGIFRAGPTGQIEYANEALADLLGVEAEALVGRDLTTFYADPVQQDRVLVEAEATEMEVEFEAPDGSTFVGLLNAKATYDADGTVRHYDGVITDITERVRRKARLRVLSAAVEQANEAVLITEAEPLDEPGPQIEYVNSAYEEMTGYAEAEVVGETPRILQGPETERDVLDSLRAALEAGEEWEGETINYKKNGESYRVQWNVSPVVGAGGEIEHWVSVQRDVTERHRREKALREREARLRGIANSIPGVVFQMGPQGDSSRRTQFVGEAAENILGISPDPAHFRERFLAHVPEPHRAPLIDSLDEATQAGRPWRFEMPFDRPDGERIWLLGSSTPTRQDGTLLYNGVLLDVTEQKEAEQDLRGAKEAAEEASRMKSAFLANMSHEIRTPLTSILGFAEAIGDEIGRDPDEVDLTTLARFSDLIERSGRRLMETLTGVLNLSKLQAGEMALDPEPVDLTAEMEAAVEEFAPQAAAADIDLTVHTGPAPVWGRADTGGLQIVLRNLLSNAIKYTDEGGTVRARVRPGNDDGTVVEVEDTGIGMDPETVSELFEAFRQASEGVERKYEGTGLGLTVTKEVLDEMGGSIEVDTEEGVGTCFAVRLPSAEAPPT